MEIKKINTSKLASTKNYNVNCMICGSELIYTKEYTTEKCYYCKKDFKTNVKCKNNHFVCDDCHRKDSISLIENYCLNSDETNPLNITKELFKYKIINMHGPEHHFLVPDVLLTAYYNKISKSNLKKEKLEVAKNRAKQVPGGFCGFCGACGGGIGAGIFISVITGSTPLANKEWAMANEITSRVLHKLSLLGGPRCCKRSVYTAILTCNEFLNENFSINLIENPNVICSFSKINKECIGENCPFNVNFKK